MFTARIHIGIHPEASTRGWSAEAGKNLPSLTGKILLSSAFCGLLVLGLPGTTAAQAIGTMRIGAQVIPAAAGWTGLGEVEAAARLISTHPGGGAVVRRTGVLQTRAELIRLDDRSLLRITVQHPKN
jgi:hypothetical protein